MGDVAMAAAVVRIAARQNPTVNFTVLTRKGYGIFFLFDNNSDNLAVKEIDLTDERYKGVSGMRRLARECIKEYSPDAVADLHYSIRTRLISLFVRLCRVKVRHIDKLRKRRKALTAEQNKVKEQLPAVVECYADVFRSLGLAVELGERVLSGVYDSPFFTSEHKNSAYAVGFAPFAAHQGKTYPEELSERVVEMLSKRGVELFIFGGGDKEAAVAERWAQKYDGVVSVVGVLDMKGQMSLISNLNVVISMDSATQHIASLLSVPVVSIWGATHPFAGFTGYGQPSENALGVPMDCRPCSVFGNKPCYKGTYECLRLVTPESVVEKVIGVIES